MKVTYRASAAVLEPPRRSTSPDKRTYSWLTCHRQRATGETAVVEIENVEPVSTDEAASRHLNRRQMLKRIAVVGSAAIWVPPVSPRIA